MGSTVLYDQSSMLKEGGRGAKLWLCGPSRTCGDQVPTHLYSGPETPHKTVRILQTMVSGIPLVLGVPTACRAASPC